MGVEAGRDYQDVRLELAQPRQDHGFERFAEGVAAVAGRERRVDDGVVFAAFADRAGAGIKRHFVGRAIHHGFIGPENILRAVAVMHVEIDDGRALGMVAVLRIARRDRRVVEQAEAHRPRRLGVVAGRANGDEGVGRLLVHHLVDRAHGAAGAAQGRFDAAGRHRGIGVEMHQAVRRRSVADRLDVFHRMRQRDDLERRTRCLLARQHMEPFVLQRLLDGAQAVRPLGMPGRVHVIEAGGMAEEQSGHWMCLTRLSRRALGF